MKAIMRDKAELRDSGIEWIGDIPSNWSNENIKYHFDVIAGATPDSKNPEYWDGDITWVTPADYKTEDKYVKNGKRSLSLGGYQSCSASLVPEGSIIFSKRAPIGTVALSATELCTNQGCLACVPQNNVDSTYYYYVMSIATEEFELKGSGTTFKEISASNFVNTKLPYPMYEEQQLIANYLDDRCSKIDAIIAEAKASIEEYKELKQAVIYEAVTKGLDKNVEMKDSGVEWIGKTPLDWQIIRVKHLLTEVNNRSVQGLEEPLSVSQVLGIVPSSEISVANPTSSYIGQKVVEQHDMVFNRLKAHLGVFFESNYKGLVSPDYAVFRGNKRINPKFLEYLFHTPAAITEFKKYITGVGDGLRRLYTDDLFNISVSIPSIEIQNEIISTLNLKVQKIDVLVSEKQSLIEDLEAYKKSLIYEVVTGKRKVVES